MPACQEVPSRAVCRASVAESVWGRFWWGVWGDGGTVRGEARVKDPVC